MTVTIQHLGYDILHQIFKLLTVHTRDDLLGCILVSKSWREIAQPMLDRRVEFCLRQNSLQNDVKILARLEDPAFQARVQELIIGRFYWDIRGDGRQSESVGAPELHALFKLIKKLRLRTLIWSRPDPFPPSTLAETIQSQHECDVHIQVETDSESYADRAGPRQVCYIAEYLPFLEPIANQLVTLQTGYFSPRQSAIHLGQVLLKARRLRSLYIVANQEGGNAERLAPPPTASLNLRQLTLANVCVCKSEAWDKWKNLSAWDLLKEATFTCPAFIHKAGHRLHRLNRLQITSYSWPRRDWCSQNHNNKTWIQGMLRMLGAELKELRYCSYAEAFDPSCVSHLRSLRVLLLLPTVLFPKERQQALQILAKALSLSQKHHPHLQQVTVQLPYSAADVHQLDVPLSNIIGNLSYVESFEVIFSNKITGDDRTWDISPVKRLWDHFESFPSRLVTGEDMSRSTVQTIEIKVLLDIVWTYNGETVCHEVEITRRWKVRRFSLASTFSIEPVTIDKDIRMNPRLDQRSYPLQSELASFFAQIYPELDQFMDFQFSRGGDMRGFREYRTRREQLESN